MRHDVIDRPAEAFQRPVPEPTLIALCARAFGPVPVTAITELNWGSYNNAYRVAFDGRDDVVLRIAPAARDQFRVERAMMRNEYAAAPFLGPVADLLPRIIFADFTHQLIDRDYLVETLAPGTPLPDAIGGQAGPRHARVFEQIGDVARRIHTVTGPAFGRVIGPHFDTWSQALGWYFTTIAQDVRDAGHDAADIDELVNVTRRHADVLDEITEPRLLHGDGWTGNFLLDPDTLAVTGVVDWDRAEWGDPLADWAIQRGLERPGSVRESFWTGYGSPRTVAGGPRQHIYRARFLLGLRLDMIRSNRAEDRSADIAANHAGVAEALARLG